MTPLLRRRLIVFCSAIGVLIVLVGWCAFTSWRELGTLRRRFTSAQFESFRTAGQLQANILEVNSALLTYAVGDDETAWQRFQTESDKLNAWIDLQRDALKTDQEKRVLAEIDAEYDRYLAVADGIRKSHVDHSLPLAARVPPLNEAAARMFALAGLLAEAHRVALGDLLGQSQHSLQRLEVLFGTGFLLILGVGGWGTRVLFRGTILPLRRQLIESQALAERHEKLASLAVLAAGVAHEIRNPLTAIKMRIFALQRGLPEGTEAARENATVIEREIDRLERVVRDFLLFARPGDPSLTSLTPDAIFHDVRELLEAELNQLSIELRIEPGENETAVRGDGHQLKQVLINLVRNAAESIGRRGRITMRARRDRLPISGDVRDVLIIEVEDTGAGIPPEVQARLFDPFFTTKSAGTGLGLSIAMRIMERHGGTLQFQTARGRGTTFGLVLPVVGE